MSLSTIQGVNDKIARARQHLTGIKTMVDEYKSLGYEIAKEFDQGSGMLNLSAKLPTTSSTLSLIAGDCLHNLRCALDHIVWQLVIANRNQPSRSNQFPVCETPQDFADNLKRRRLAGVYPNAVTAIEQLQPYNTRTDRLLVLSELNNVDKHRALVVTALIVTRQAITLTDPQTGETVTQITASNTTFRNGFLIAGLNTQRDLNVSVTATTELVFGDSPASNADLYSTLSETIDYIETTVIPSLKQWLV